MEQRKRKFLMTYGRKQITCPPGITEGEAESLHKHISNRQDQKQYIAASERPQLQSLHLCSEPLALWDCSALRYRSKAVFPWYYKLILNFKNSTSKRFYVSMSQLFPKQWEMRREKKQQRLRRLQAIQVRGLLICVCHALQTSAQDLEAVGRILKEHFS